MATLVQTALQRGDQRIPLGLDLVLDIKDLLPLPALQAGFVLCRYAQRRKKKRFY